MTQEQKQELQTLVDGLEYAIQDIESSLKVAQDRLRDLKEELQDKPKEEF